jgi:hypothetical protein
MKTKNTYLFISFIFMLLFLFAAQVNAQKIEVSPFIGYETGAYADVTLGRLHINDGMDFGGSLNIGMGGGRYAELSFSQMYSALSLQNGPVTTDLSDMVVDYYSIGVLQELNPKAKATPYGLFTLGIVNYNPSSSLYSNENKMHISFAGGVKVRASERIGLRLQARLLLPIYYEGGYIFAGSGGAGYGVTGGFRGVQGDFTASLYFMLK